MSNEQQIPETDAWLAAEEDTDGGFEEVDEGGEDLVVDEPDESDQDIEEDIDEPESDDDEPEDALEAEASPAVFEWDGDPDKLPPEIVYEGNKYDLKKVFRTMQAGYTKRMQEVAEQRRHYEQAAAQAMQLLESRQREQAAASDPRPANPTDTMSDDEYNRRVDEIQQWNARQAYRAMVEKGDVPDPQRVMRQTQEYELVAEANRRAAMVSSLDGYTDQIGNRMVEMAEADPAVASMMTTDAGIKAVFRQAKLEAENAALKAAAARKHEASVRRKARAPRNAVSRSTSSPAKSAADNFKKWGFAEAEAAALEELG